MYVSSQTSKNWTLIGAIKNCINSASTDFVKNLFTYSHKFDCKL